VRFSFFVIVMLLICAVNSYYRKFQNEARQDYLTGLANIRCFYDILQTELIRFKRYNQPFSIAYIDIDNFKKVNDQLGHLQGNILLKTISQKLSVTVRSSDTPARVGGDEFVVLFINTDEDQVKAAIKKLMKEINKVIKTNGWPVSLSVGVVIYKKLPKSVDDAIKMADDLMYEVKSRGKNNAFYKIFS
jgi:diguanylate cyclase (GGDEF)-like protein